MNESHDFRDRDSDPITGYCRLQGKRRYKSLNLYLHIYIFFSLLPPVFVEEPGPGPVVSPIGTPIELTCSVSGGYTLRWFVKVLGFNNELGSADDLDTMALNSRGITVKDGFNSTSSHLVINVTQLNNSVEYVECEAVLLTDTSTRTRSDRVDVTIFGTACYLIEIE